MGRLDGDRRRTGTRFLGGHSDGDGVRTVKVDEPGGNDEAGLWSDVTDVDAGIPAVDEDCRLGMVGSHAARILAVPRRLDDDLEGGVLTGGHRQVEGGAVPPDARMVNGHRRGRCPVLVGHARQVPSGALAVQATIVVHRPGGIAGLFGA